MDGRGGGPETLHVHEPRDKYHNRINGYYKSVVIQQHCRSQKILDNYDPQRYKTNKQSSV